MNYVSLFTGIGGFDLALNHAGHTAIAMVERDKACQGVLRRRFPGVPLFDDVTTFGKKDIPDATVDIVCGGSPCQSFSVAGLRKSLSDQRGNLAFEFCRIVNELKPAYVIWENVPGVLNTKDNAFGCFLAALVGEDTPLVPPRGKWTNAGLVAGPERSAAWRVLDAQYFGVAQRRRRVFVVASAASASRGCDEILFECEGVHRDTPPRRQARESVAGFAPTSIGGYTEGLGTLRANGGDIGGGSENIVVKIDNTKSNGWGVLDDGTTHSLGGSTDAIAFAPGNLVRRAGENPSTEVFGTLGADKLGDMFPHVAQVYDARGNGTGDVTPNLRAEHGDSGDYTPIVVHDARGNGDGNIVPNLTGDHANRITDYTPVVVRLTDRTESRGNILQDGTTHSVHNKPEAVVVQQNTRDEVRLVNGDGQIAGAISAEAGMHQQNYVVQQNAVGDPDVANSVETKVRGNFDQQDGTAIVAFDWQHGGDKNSRSSIVRSGEYATIRATTTPAIMHNATVRRLTPTECERLQAFPDGWTEQRATKAIYSTPETLGDEAEIVGWETTEQADTPRYKQLGNAVCVNVVEWIARRIPV